MQEQHAEQAKSLLTVLANYQNLGTPKTIVPITMGLINKTYLVTCDAEKFIFQELSSIFTTAVMDDAWAVSSHLEQKGLRAPTLLHTDKGQLFVTTGAKVFRALKYIEGKSYHAVTSPTMAHTAALALATFHEALIDFDYEYRSTRRHGGDYAFHQENLIAALRNHADHDYFKRIEPLATSMITAMTNLTKGFSTTPRHAHGDPKISNLLFNDDNQAICLVDFDTLGKTGWSLEVADALRSWCNPYPEDVLDAHVDLAIAEQTLSGYGSIMGPHFSEHERDELLVHAQAITLCLAMRYAADTLNESYFLHDQNRFSRPAEHNLLKTNSMYKLFRDFSQKSSSLKTMVGDLLG